MTGGIASLARPVNQESIAWPTWHLTSYGGHPFGGGVVLMTGVGTAPGPAQCGIGSPGNICTLGQRRDGVGCGRGGGVDETAGLGVGEGAAYAAPVPPIISTAATTSTAWARRACRRGMVTPRRFV
jgi:hypothetical protein